MAYFSNGCEGMDYMDEHCNDCVHDPGCKVLLAHQLHNYKECNNPESILHILIPRLEDGSNGACGMYHQRSEGDCP
jgi:hypothetical protein